MSSFIQHILLEFLCVKSHLRTLVLYRDLGMEMEYKTSLGAKLVSRMDFVCEVHRTRVEDKNLILRCEGRRNAKEIIDFDRPTCTAEVAKVKQKHGTKHEQTIQNGGATKRIHKDYENNMK